MFPFPEGQERSKGAALSDTRLATPVPTADSYVHSPSEYETPVHPATVPHESTQLWRSDLGAVEMAFPAIAVPHWTINAWPVEERYARPLSLGQLKSGIDVAVGTTVNTVDGSDMLKEVSERELVATNGVADAVDVLPDVVPVVGDAAALLAATGNKVGRPGSPGRILLVGKTRAVESPPKRFELIGSAMLTVDRPANGFETLGI